MEEVGDVVEFLMELNMDEMGEVVEVLMEVEKVEVGKVRISSHRP